MSYSLISGLILLTNLFSSDIQDSAFQLPKTWTNDFTISLSHSGSMSGGSTQLTFTYDTCKYVRSSGHEAPKNSVFILTESDRVEILNKMHELKVDKIRSEMSLHVVNDGWSESICFNTMNCIEGGTSAEMSSTDRELFHAAFGYLEEFAIKKSKKKSGQ